MAGVAVRINWELGHTELGLVVKVKFCGAITNIPILKFPTPWQPPLSTLTVYEKGNKDGVLGGVVATVLTEALIVGIILTVDGGEVG